METKKPNSIDIFKPIKKLSKRFHLIMFFIFIVACLSGAVLLISKTLEQGSADPNYTSPISAGAIDQATLNRLNAHHTSAEGAPAPVLPPGRINPVGE